MAEPVMLDRNKSAVFSMDLQIRSVNNLASAPQGVVERAAQAALLRSGPSAALAHVRVQGHTLPPRFEKICHALADHNRRGIGVGANAIRHDRGVRNP
jgi:hypothetical protein